jgi:hypothetical protein
VERKTNISVWQLRLFEGFDKDIMVMQRDEEEVFDNAIHVFFDKKYYDAYVSKALKYGIHRYAYHEDKLGEVINQIFDENIGGLVLHISINDDESKGIPGEEKYISSKDLMGLKDVADSYHYLYTTSIDRCDKNDAIARLWMKYVYIIGQLPNPRIKPKEGEKQVFELLTMKRKNDGQPVTADDYDYESLKVFLTPDSAMRFNPDKKPISKYKLSLLSQIVKGKLRVIIEPHRNYWIEYNPSDIDLKGHLNIPVYNEKMVEERIKAYTRLDKVYILLAPGHSDYRLKVGNPLLVRPDDKNIVMYIFEKYEDAAGYVLQNPNLLPVLDSTFPIGEVTNLEEVVYVAAKLGVTIINLDTDTLNAIGCKMDFFKKNAGYDREIEEFLDDDELAKVMRVENEQKQYRMPLVRFSDQINDYDISDERKTDIISHIDNDLDGGLSYTAGCSIAEMTVMVREAADRFEKARKENDEENKVKYNRLMNLFTVPLTEALCEKPYIYTLRDEKGEFVKKNNIIYLIMTNRYEAGRKGEGRLAPVSIDNPEFMEKLCEMGNVAVLTDGPSLMCFVDTRLMKDVAIQWKKSEALREEIMIYMTQGLDMSYADARYYYRRLKSDSSVFAEFISTMRAGDYPTVGMLNIEGNTAKELADTNGYSVLEAYDTLLSIKINTEYVQDNNESHMASDTEHNIGKEDKKGILGKIFKK